MPGIVAPDAQAKKRKRTDDAAPATKHMKSRKAPKKSDEDNILLLEQQILESQKHYNNIVTLLSYAQDDGPASKRSLTACVALCRVFCRLIAAEKLVRHNGLSDAQAKVVNWLRDRYKEYENALQILLGHEDAALQSTGLTLFMRLVKEETSQGSRRSEQAWRTGMFRSLFKTLLGNTGAQAAAAREEFVEKYVEEHDDVRFYTFLAVAQFVESAEDKDTAATNGLALLSKIEGIPESADQLEDWYGEAPETPKHQLLSLSAHKRHAQDAWLAVLRCPLNKDQRKQILSIMTPRIIPWLTRVEALTDFLTDSYNAGGSTSLLALSGLFYLIQHKNLEYPDFYRKLYSLLDDSILHSKHRARFFRLLDTFMASTHLPAALVASFIKRLSRLCLQAPPGGIVVVVPWVYNMLKKHLSCTFMLHRIPSHPSLAGLNIEDQGMDDPFNMAEPDPMLTNAIDSSLWELETLQSHYHPNVATLAMIISEQFTKRDYQLEDFLDHTYASMVEAELGKELKRAPVVEWEIPKRIVTTDDGGPNGIGELLQAAINA